MRKIYKQTQVYISGKSRERKSDRCEDRCNDRSNQDIADMREEALFWLVSSMASQASSKVLRSRRRSGQWRSAKVSYSV